MTPTFKPNLARTHASTVFAASTGRGLANFLLRNSGHKVFGIVKVMPLYCTSGKAAQRSRCHREVARALCHDGITARREACAIKLARNSRCFASSSRTRTVSSHASNCSTRFGAITATQQLGPWIRTFYICDRRWRTIRVTQRTFETPGLSADCRKIDGCPSDRQTRYCLRDRPVLRAC
jgi:hypothetical protein